MKGLVVFRPCAWCGCQMQTERSSKKLCSVKCQNQFHYWRHKHYPGKGPAYGFEMLKTQKQEVNSQ